ncbi:MAG: glycoside hydrolase domain-containing protein [Armatimonadia bacterium]
MRNRLCPACLLLVVVLVPLAYAVPAQVVPLATVPLMRQAPVIDGKLAPGEWDQAVGLGMFTVKGKLVPEQPVIYLACDGQSFLVGARFPLPEGKAPARLVKDRDGALWQDDALEVFLASGGDASVYHQFIVNAANARYDGERQNAGWNGEWSSATFVGQGFWSLEMAIPLSTLKATAADGQTWRANFAWDCKTPSSFLATWAPIVGNLHQSASFGELVFSAKAPGFQLAGPRVLPEGRLEFSGHSNGQVKGRVVLSEMPGARQVGEASGVLGPDADLTVAIPIAEGRQRPGEYQLRAEVTGMTGTPLLLAQRATVEILPPLQVEVEKYWIQGQLVVKVDASRLQTAQVKLALLDAQGSQIGAAEVPVGADGRGAVTLSTTKLVPGKYTLRTDTLDKAGVALASSIVALDKPVRPTWLDSSAGVTDEVLPPWTALKAAGSKVSPWGRTYSFGPLPFPASVVTRGTEVLAGPVTLTGRVGGKALIWTGKPARCTANKASLSTFDCAAQAGGLSCEGKVSVEYDGMIRTDFRLKPRGATQVDSLSLEVPIKAEYAKYMYFWPGGWGSAYNASALPANGFQGPFKPTYWLGDEWRGFCWFAESDRNFFNPDAAKVVSITPDGKVVRLRISLIGQPTEVKAPLDYTFGFMATPVKPMQPDVWDYRYVHAGNYGMEKYPYHPNTSILYPAQGNLDLKQGSFECWVRPHFDPNAQAGADVPSRGMLNRNFLNIDLGNGDQVYYYWNIDARGMRFFTRQGGKIDWMDDHRTEWQQDEWHHLAFTWGEAIRLYMDGKLVAEKPRQGLVAGSTEKGFISLGDAPSEMDFAELRLSSVARASFDLTRPPVADEQTLLLDRFTDTFTPNGGLATHPVKGSGGVPSGGVFGPGKFGQALLAPASARAMTYLDYLRETGVRNVVFHEHWTDLQNYPTTTHGEQLHSLVKACHEAKLQLLLYYGYLMANTAPEWDNYHDECLVAPRTGDYHRSPEQWDYMVCLNSPWQSFLLDGLDKQLTEYGNDGVYLDGTSEPFACTNTHHGCGYVRPDGTIGPTYPIFAVRRAMKRIQTIVLRHNPKGLVNVHQSTCMTIPTLSFANSYWDGEQFQGTDRGRFALDVLPLDAFRAEFMGHNWGVPAEFLCTGKAYTAKEAFAFTLLHDVPIRGDLGTLGKLWKTFDQFGKHEAIWLPYWENQRYVTTGSPDVKVSLYNRPGLGAIAIISNLGRTPRQPQVKLDLAALRLAQALVAQEVMTSRRVDIADGKLDLPEMKSLDFAVVWVRPAAR